MNIFWPNTISNIDIASNWIGNVIRMPSDAIPKIALRWTPNAGRRRRVRPKGDMEKIIRARNEGEWIILGPG